MIAMIVAAVLIWFLTAVVPTMIVQTLGDIGNFFHSTKNQVTTPHYNKMDADAGKLESYSDSITNYYNEPDWRNEDIDWEDEYSS